MEYWLPTFIKPKISPIVSDLLNKKLILKKRVVCVFLSKDKWGITKKIRYKFPDYSGYAFLLCKDTKICY
jgi:hypothetical protein